MSKKQNVVLTRTRACIIEILKIEFDIDVNRCHEVELDIYVKVIRRYLKIWPEWKELACLSIKLSNVKDFDALGKLLDNKYKRLKDYLNVKLEAAKPITKMSVDRIKEREYEEKKIDSGEVVMEVFSTRAQLDKFIFRKPRADLDNSIFNLNQPFPYKCSSTTLTFGSILNFAWTKIYIQLPNLIYFRELCYKYTHTLVNKVRDEEPPSHVLDTRVFNTAKEFKEMPKQLIIEYFDKILLQTKDQEIIQMLTILFQVLKTDLKYLPNTVKIPSSYRKHANQYNYVRYLYVENKESNDTKYDLQLEEVLTPSHQIIFLRFFTFLDTIPSIEDWLKIECMMCKMKFSGSNKLMRFLEAHFEEYHKNELDWKCPHCQRTFNIAFLAKNRWFHEC